MKNSVLVLLGVIIIVGPLVFSGTTANVVNSTVDLANSQGSSTAAWGGLIILAAPIFFGFLILAKGLLDDDD